METNREVARRKPPAADLTACLYRSTDVMYGSHKTKKGAQMRTIHHPVTGSIECRSRDYSPNGAALPFQNRGNISQVKDNIEFVKGKGMKYF